MSEQILANSAKYQVQKTLHNIWEHALVDSKTQQFRAESLSQMDQVLIKYGLTQDTVAVIRGSALWVPDNISDRDFSVVSISEVSAEILRKNSYTIYDSTGIEFGLLSPQDIMLRLLLTPDEYIVGNLKLTRKLRLAFVNNPARQFDTAEIWDDPESETKTFFRYHFKSWKDIPGKSSSFWTDPISKTSNRTRYTRFQQRLKERSEQSKLPQLWRKKFLDALENFSLPPFNTYKKALTATNGSLSLLTPDKTLGTVSS